MDEEFKIEVRASLKRLEIAMRGDPEIGLTGVIPRLARAEHWIRKADLRMAAIGGGAVTLAWLIEHFWPAK